MRETSKKQVSEKKDIFHLLQEFVQEPKKAAYILISCFFS